MTNPIKLFNKWDVEGVEVQDAGLKKYMSLNPTYVPHTGARYAGNKFHKSKIFIVERLINKINNPGHKGKKHHTTSGRSTGKSQTSYLLVEQTFDQVYAKLKKNPVEVFVRAIENAAPREEIISIEYGGARYPKAVECAPQRRIDLALRYFTQGAYAKSFNSKRSAVSCLAEEIIGAYEMSASSAAISKKLELERQADASR